MHRCKTVNQRYQATLSREMLILAELSEKFATSQDGVIAVLFGWIETELFLRTGRDPTATSYPVTIQQRADKLLIVAHVKIPHDTTF